MTLKEIKKYYNVRKMDGYYDLSSLEVGNSRMVHKHICSIYKVKNGCFKLNGYLPTFKINVLLKQIKDYILSLPYDSEYYCPSYIKGTAQNWFLHDKLNEYGFKMGGYNEPSGYSLNRSSLYGYILTPINISYKVLEDEETVNIYLNTGKYSWVKVKCGFDLKEIHNTLDSLLKPLLLTEGIKNIRLSEKMNMSPLEIELLELTNNGISTSKMELKKKLLSIVDKM